MRDGYVKVAAAALDVRVADCGYNCRKILEAMDQAHEAGAKVLALPELCLTGYSCQDLLLQQTLRQAAWNELMKVVEHSAGMELLTFVGLPYAKDGRLYNCAAAVLNGRLLALIPKTHIPNYNEFYEGRYFAPAPAENCYLEKTGPFEQVIFGKRVLFRCPDMPEFVVGCEICEDLWAPYQPSEDLALAGATILVNLSASPAVIGKGQYRCRLVSGQSARLICGYVYSCASCRESTQDLVFSGHCIIAENGSILTQSTTMEPNFLVTELDVRHMAAERARQNTYCDITLSPFWDIPVDFHLEDTTLTRTVDPHPFVPSEEAGLADCCDEVLTIQASGLARRLSHTHAESAVVGLSGGLDSTLALLVMVRAADMLGWDRKRLWAVTMPCYGTSGRTRSNAEKMAALLGVTFREIPIGNAVTQHFKDIGLPEDDRSVTFENSQARERTQVLMDLSNRLNGLVIGTGDLSELALGWATYNGDHMSMYGVNAGVPKTLAYHIVVHAARNAGDELRQVLLDILDTPVSPELLPPTEGQISQVTEDLVGPYELHDFFLYQTVRCGFSPRKTFRLAKLAFEGRYTPEAILKWLRNFYRRFFQQQFKRSCLPDGPKVGSVTLSPRGDWRMPSDAWPTLWLQELDEL